MEKLLSPREASEYLGLATQTLAKWRCEGLQGPAFVRVGRLIRYRQNDLRDWLDQHTVGSRET